MPEQSRRRSFRFPVNKMDKRLSPFLWTVNERYELVKLIMREEELELPSSATKAKNLCISIIRNI